VAGAVATGQPAPILLAMERINKQLKLVAADNPAPAPGS
jgi:hypothetical protein